MRRAEYVAGMEENINAYRSLLKQPERKALV
jgi:hypothetical protein